MSRFRAIKKSVREILAAADWQERLSELEEWAPGQLAGPLFSLRLDKEENVRWRTVVAFGLVADRMANAGMEKARVLMRTFMWYMNEESGNLGWGIPEAMAESMVRNEKLAREFGSILNSYIYCDESCDGNYLDHPDLRRGVFWGLGRLAQVRPELVSKSEKFLVAALADEDSHNRGLAAWTLGILGAESACELLEKLLEDTGRVALFEDGELRETTVSEQVRRALNAIDSSRGKKK